MMTSKRLGRKKKCEICPKEFISDGHADPFKNRFCSRQCAGIGRRTHKSKVCPRCKKDFYSYRDSDRCCSKMCSAMFMRLENNPKWRGGRFVSKTTGYAFVYSPKHPAAKNYGYVSEHRLVMEKILGRYLYVFENVHHRNGIRSDNSEANLELWTKPQACGQRPTDLAEWVVKNYPKEVEMWISLRSEKI